MGEPELYGEPFRGQERVLCFPPGVSRVVFQGRAYAGEKGNSNRHGLRLDFGPQAALNSKPMIQYRTGNDLDLDQVIDLYKASTLGERRPIDDRARFAAMLKNANLVITAWDDE